MPESIHPPYVSGATTIPRQLQRWLDINPQNGRLKRTETFIQVPVFDIDHVWNGYSEIVGEYHFTSPNQLSLKLSNIANILPTGTNYTLCVSYISGVGTVARYSLVRGLGDLFYFNLPEYDGERLINDFVIEVWNTSQVACSSTTVTTIYTSVAGNLDYRYGIDGPLALPTPICMGQQPPGTQSLVPVPVNLELWLDGGSGWSEHLWVDRSASLNFTSNTDMSTRTPPNAIQLGGSVYIGDVVHAQSSWLYVITGPQNNVRLLHYDNGAGALADVSIDGLWHLQVSLDPGATFTGTYVLQPNTAYILYFEGGSDCRLFDAVTLAQLDHIVHDTINLITPDVAITIADSSFVLFQVRALLCYDDVTFDPFYTDSIFPYMQALPSGAVVMTLPLVFDPCGTHPNLPPVGIIAVG